MYRKRDDWTPRLARVMGVGRQHHTVSSKILKFADDTKITATISSLEERNTLQTDQTRLMEWSEELQIKLNVNKRIVMDFGYISPSYVYSMNDEVLIETEEEIDLGVIIHKSLNHNTKVW